MTAGWSSTSIALIVAQHRRLRRGCCGGPRGAAPGDPAPTDTSHVWDGDITEYNKPLPRWWINLFYMTIVFAIGYLVWYPGFGNFAGTASWTSQREHDADRGQRTMPSSRETFAPYRRPADRRAGARIRRRVALGRSIFGNTCAACHGSSAQGAIGYPNLTDDIWHWGGAPDRVLQTVLDGREGVMPAWGKVLDRHGRRDAVDYVAAYVRTLSEPEADAGTTSWPRRASSCYDGVCAACHGADGKGNPALGAPDLTDDYWLYGDSSDALRKTIAERPPRLDAGAPSRCSAKPARAWPRPTSGRCRTQPDATAAMTRRPMQRSPPASTTRRGRMAQRLGAILWPSFFAAGVATMVFFAFVDPLAAARHHLSRAADDARAGLHDRLLHVLGRDRVVAACSPGSCCARPAASTGRCRRDVSANEQARIPLERCSTTAARSTSANARSIRATSPAASSACAWPRWSWLLGMFYVFPWLRWDGRQAVLFDLPARKFHVFGLTFWPQDFLFLALLLIIAGAGAVLLHRAGRPPVVRLCLPADGVDRSVPVDGALDRGRPRRSA